MKKEPERDFDTDERTEPIEQPDWLFIMGISWIILLVAYLFFMLVIVAMFSLVDTTHWMTTMGWWATGTTVLALFIIVAIYDAKNN